MLGQLIAIPVPNVNSSFAARGAPPLLKLSLLETMQILAGFKEEPAS